MADSIPYVSGQDPDGEASGRTHTETSGARTRILQAMTRLTVDRGYDKTTIRLLLAESHVARATFYHQFADKLDCLIGAQAHCARLLLGVLSDGQKSPWSTLIRFTSQHPYATRLLAYAPQLSDRRLLDEHSRWRNEIAAAIGARENHLNDLLVAPLSQGLILILAQEAGKTASQAVSLDRQITLWIDAYRSIGLDPARWTADQVPAKQSIDSAPSSTALERDDQPDSARLRILRALLLETNHDGSPPTVGDIAALARVSRESFYGHFADRSAAIEHLRQIIFGEVIALGMREFILHDSWPEQLWQVGHTLVSFFEEHPRLLRFLFLTPPDTNASGTPDCLDAFGVFIEPGIGDLEPASRRLRAHLTVAAIFELLYDSAYKRTAPRAQLPCMTFLALAPSIGASEAIRFIDKKLGVSP